MPCFDPDTVERPIRLEQKVHCLTDMLCRLCGQVEPGILEANPDIAAWWQAHKAQDKMIADLVRKRELQGYGALTPDENWLLIKAQDASY